MTILTENSIQILTKFNYSIETNTQLLKVTCLIYPMSITDSRVNIILVIDSTKIVLNYFNLIMLVEIISVQIIFLEEYFG